MKRALILLLVLVICFSFLYAAVESVHDCSGEAECPICKIIAVLSRIFISVEALFVSVIVLSLAAFVNYYVIERDGEPSTLIDLRVKLTF